MNSKLKYLKLLVEDIHSVSLATLDEDNHPVSRIIDMMHYDEEGIYFLTAQGKDLYTQLMAQKYIAISGTRDKRAVSLSGKIKNAEHKYLDLIFDKNEYMKDIYPDNARDILNVFCLYEAQGEYFDISNPSHIIKEHFTVGDIQMNESGYYVTDSCIGCKICYSFCPQKCIDISSIPVRIIQNRCLNCGRCFNSCPKQAIIKRG
ncbi:MAG: 4Fe-4S binding protein [Erysipelotrichaceae bacterium]